MLLRFNLLESGAEELFDEEGVDLPDLGAARTMAFAAAREILAERIVRCGSMCLDWSIEVTDVSGAVVLTVPFADVITVGAGMRGPDAH